MSDLIPIERIENRILLIRGRKVLLDRDLAELYGVETKRLVEQVKRNLKRFPSDFMFQLSKEEFENWRSQIATSNSDRMGLRRPPYAFNEYGIAMLSSVLKSEKAIQMNVAIMRAFIKMREILLKDKEVSARMDEFEDRLGTQEIQTIALMDQLTKLRKQDNPSKDSKHKIGFNSDLKS